MDGKDIDSNKQIHVYSNKNKNKKQIHVYIK